ncbi:MAG: hypothetical protein ACK5MR_15755 [Cumulibacter sp.]
MSKQEATPEAVTETTTPAGMTKDVTVYVVKAGETAVNFPTKAKAKAAHEALQMFGIASSMETAKKKIAI